MKKLKYVLIILLIILSIPFLINGYVKLSVTNKILSNEKVKDLKDVDCILILGAGLWNNKPSPLLRDRLDTGISLYKEGIAPKIVVSGDHINKDYDEVNAMKKYAIDKEVISSDIFMDHAGISTYDSIYRIKNIFNAKKIIIVTQEYHLYRALYIAKRLGLDAYGVKANSPSYSGDTKREVREILARNKDFIKSIIKPKSKYLGNTISLTDSGNVTNDKKGTN